MKKLLLTAAIAFAVLTSTESFAQQGFGTNTPDKSSAVDIVSSKRGLLIPRISIPDLNAAAPVTAPATSLFVYNTNTTSGVGFYYWDGAKWVRFTSTANEKNVVVAQGENIKVDTDTSVANTTKYTVSVKGGTAPGQVLVTKETTPGVFTTEWVKPDTFIDGVNGVTVTTDAAGITTVGLGGSLEKPTEINTTTGNTLAIKGLEELTSTNFDSATQNIVVMGPDGILKEVSPKVLLEDAIDAGLTAKAIKSAGIITLNGVLTDATNTVLKDVTLGIADKSITTDKLSSVNPGTTTNAADGTVATADGNGNVNYESPSSAFGKTLTTDGKITVLGGTTPTTMDNAVLVPTSIAIAPNSITSGDIKDGTITTTDIQAPDSTTNLGGTANQVMVTDSNGNVTWVSQESVAKKDNYNFTAPLAKDAGVANAAGGKDYTVTIANANGTTAGVVKEAPTNPSVTIIDGVLAVNPAQVAMSGDVTGTAGANEVSKIQGVTVDAKGTNAPTNGEVLTYDDATKSWAPKTPTVDADDVSDAKDVTTDGIIKVGGADLLTGAVLKTVALSIADNSITATQIATGAVGSDELAPNAVTTAKIADDAVTAAKINVDVAGTGLKQNATSGALEVDITATGIGKTLSGAGITVTPGANVTPGTTTSLAATVLADVTLGIADGAITTTKLAADAVTTEKIAPNAVTNSDIANGAVSADKMTSNTGAGGVGTPAADGMVATANGTGGVTYKTVNSTVNVINGLRKDATAADVIKLGGDLTENTKITTNGTTANTFNLAIENLVAPANATASDIVYAQTADGVLRKAARSLTDTFTATKAVSAITNYNDFVQEINVNATIGASDINVTLPTASATNKGQVVNVKITNTTESDFYVNIIDGSTTLAYGALPYQGWIVKSDGSKWIIVGRN